MCRFVFLFSVCVGTGEEVGQGWWQVVHVEQQVRRTVGAVQHKFWKWKTYIVTGNNNNYHTSYIFFFSRVSWRKTILLSQLGNPYLLLM